MDNLNKEFAIPRYIAEEIEEYIELTNQGYCKIMKWENIKSLLGMAKINNRLTEQQVKFLIEKFCREKSKKVYIRK